MEVVRPFELQSSSSGLSKNFSFWTGSLDLDAMFKIK